MQQPSSPATPSAHAPGSTGAEATAARPNRWGTQRLLSGWASAIPDTGSAGTGAPRAGLKTAGARTQRPQTTVAALLGLAAPPPASRRDPAAPPRLPAGHDTADRCLGAGRVASEEEPQEVSRGGLAAAEVGAVPAVPQDTGQLGAAARPGTVGGGTPRPRSAADDVDAFFAQLRSVAASEVDGDLDLVHGGIAEAQVAGEAPSVPQADAMVLNLEDPFVSSPSVLELELGRMDLEELQAFEAHMDRASIASASCAASAVA